MAADDPYSRLARIYDRIIEPLQAPVRQIALEVLPPVAGWEVLDVGCGTGTGLMQYLQAGCAAFGVDVSAAMLDQARRRLGDRAELHLTDGTGLPFADDRFDLVTTTLVLHEIGDDARAAVLSEMARVAKPGSKVLVTDFRFGSLRGWRGPAVRGLSWLIERLSGHYGQYKSFKQAGGIPALTAGTPLGLDREKITAGGNMAIYVLDPTR